MFLKRLNLTKRYGHHDPTFDAVYGRELKDCHGCKHKRMIFDREICDHPAVQNKKLIRCKLFERDILVKML
jgi:hypothetical protein